MVARRGPWNIEEAAELGMLIACSRRLMWAEAARRLERRGESMVAWQVLNNLRRFGAATQCELAFRVGQHPAGISRMVDSLEGLRQVKRSRDRRDRRKLHVTLTPAGRRWLAAADPELAAAAEKVLAPLSVGERRSLRCLLAKLLGVDLAGRSPARRR